MVELTNEDVLKLARLARLRLNDDECGVFKKEISSILGYVEQLDKVDLKDVVPTYQVTGLTNVTRPDTEIDYGASTKELLKNAPALENNQIKVKRMLDR
ncbi:Asp-tRNA(Asn)/Glu-tRNA(Gln) amidotransferase subunit GatC [Candidatus Saccharibacteria bacterium]|nr:Asp-tRNA(Asn)/Glu-tRNA(Gln) amidotransferase subunit GatC [Candidatus Saccharibacteria bacterium]